MNIKFSVVIISLVVTFTCYSSAENSIAKVVEASGNVAKLNPITGEISSIKKDDFLQEGYFVETKKRSYIKLEFIVDKTIMSIAPSSRILIKNYSGEKTGLINLIQGEVRAHITKNYVNIPKDRSKLIIKTKTAAMGVRGTEIQMGHNEESGNTSVLLFSGEALVVKFDHENANEQIDPARTDQIDALLSSGESQIMTEGEAIIVTINERLGKPFYINKHQLNIFKNSSMKDRLIPTTQKPLVRDINPPMITKQVFTNEQDIKRAPASKDPDYPTVSRKNGAIINLGTGELIAPPSFAKFDKENGVYIMPKDIEQSIDNKTGMVVNNQDKNSDSNNSARARGPASVTEKFQNKNVSKENDITPMKFQPSLIDISDYIDQVKPPLETDHTKTNVLFKLH